MKTTAIKRAMSMNSSNQTFDFETLYKKHQHAVRMVVARFPFHDAAAEDLVQDTFVQAWQNREALKDPNAFSGWIVSIARNRCLNELRRQRPQVSIAMTDVQGDAEKHEMELVLVADDNSLSIQFEHSLLLLRRLIDMHTDSPRAAAAKLFYIDHKPVKIIADELNMNLNTVLSHLRRFRLVVSQAMLRLVEEKDITISDRPENFDEQYLARLLRDSERLPRRQTASEV